MPFNIFRFQNFVTNLPSCESTYFQHCLCSLCMFVYNCKTCPSFVSFGQGGQCYITIWFKPSTDFIVVFEYWFFIHTLIFLFLFSCKYFKVEQTKSKSYLNVKNLKTKNLNVSWKVLCNFVVYLNDLHIAVTKKMKSSHCYYWKM